MPAVILVVFAIVVFAAWSRFSNFDVNKCPTSLDAEGWPTGAFTAIIGGFLLGGLLGKLPHRNPGSPNPSPGLWAQGGLTLFLILLTVAWGYETFAVANHDSWHPLTFYIMCVKTNEGDWTLLVVIMTALMAGRWLWHREGAYFS